MLPIVTFSYMLSLNIYAIEAFKTLANDNEMKNNQMNLMFSKALQKLIADRKNFEKEDKPETLPELSSFKTRHKFKSSTKIQSSIRQFIHHNPYQATYQTLQNKKPSTGSFIEFHYMDNSDFNKSVTNTLLQNYQAKTIQNSMPYRIAYFHPPYLIFRISQATCKIQNRKLLPDKNILTNKKNLDQPKDVTKTSNFKSGTNLSDNNKTYGHKTLSSLINSVNRNISFPSDNKTEIGSLIFTKQNIPMPESTWPNDRIKFFEIYDKFTYPSPALLFQQEKMTTYIKKSEIDGSKTTKALKFKRNYATPIESNQNSTNPAYLSKAAPWINFPFVAVYIYEPSQVRCDCACISSHWLVAAATCLYHHRSDPRMDERSAFISFCGDNWRRPGRVAYVKRSIIHPHFKESDKIRRLLYNIGIIQVASSMSNTCNGWQPIPLMSHQFVAERDVAFATAVGWGLDRYDVTYTDSELPTHKLMLYEAPLHSGSCPGNLDYSKAKHFNEESVKNVYCLSLPTYIKEDNDPVHGSLLLVEGKLIALYLQEERRTWGAQSAQYTAIWRVIPWLLDTAREKEELDM